jgi:DNA-binding CsgD family transcriptional regulator
MLRASGIVGLCEHSREITRMRAQKFAVAACVLNIMGFLRCGGFLLDCKRRVLFLNPIAADYLGNGLTLRRDCLAATDRESDARLQRLIERALNLTDDADALSASIEVHRTANLPLLVRMLRLEENVRPALNWASLLLIAFDPEIRRAPPADMLARMFALTPAEAGVAIGIVGGRHLAEIAADRGVTTETVRAHSKTLFSKTRTRGQAELAALLTRLAFLVAHHEAGIGQANAKQAH